MPTYEVTLVDGRVLHVDADRPPTPDEVTKALYPNPNRETASGESLAPASDTSRLVNPPTTGGFLRRIVPDAIATASQLAEQTPELAKRMLVPQLNMNPTTVAAVRGAPGAMVARAKADMDPAEIYQHPAGFIADAAGLAEGGVGLARGTLNMGRALGRNGVARAVLKGAAEDVPVLRGGMKAYKNYQEARAAGRAAASEIPTGTASGLDRHMPNTSPVSREVAPGAVIPPNPMEGLDRFMPNTSAPSNSGATVEDAASQEVQRLLGSQGEAGQATGAPPVENVPPTPQGAPASPTPDAGGTGTEDPFTTGVTDYRTDTLPGDPRDPPVRGAGMAEAAPAGDAEDALHQALLEKLGGTAGTSAEATVSQPAGTPRVLNWKPGAGPTVEDATRMRREFGSRTGAQRLKTTQGQIKALTPDMESALPDAAKRAIDAKLATMGPDELQTYLAAAPNPLARAYIQSKLGGP